MIFLMIIQMIFHDNILGYITGHIPDDDNIGDK